MSRKKQLTVYRVRAGSITRLYFTDYHAEQMARALRGNGMTVIVDTVQLPDDPLTRLAVQP